MSRRTAPLLMGLAALLGAAVALAALLATGGRREPQDARLLTLILVAGPALFGAAWLLLRPFERRLAAACVAALYFFLPFAAARIESVIDPAAAARLGGPHLIYFYSLIALQLLGSFALTLWRVRAERAGAVSAAPKE